MDVVPDRTRVLLALIVSGVIVVALHLRRRIEDHLRHRGRGRGRRRWWVRPVNRRREQQGLYHNLFADTAVEDHEEFFDACRMWPEQFEWLHAQVAPFLRKYSRRIPLSPRHRLAMTLRYLAQGGTVKSLHDQFRVGRSTCHKVIGETCTAIWQALQPIYLPQPTQDMWLSNASRFFERWQMPHCVGAVDGRHMRVKAPPNTGSKYWNYEKFFSMVLLAVCDDAYKFVVVDVGQYGSISDGGVWANSDFGQALSGQMAGIPPATPLPGTNNPPFPYYIVGDEAFPLSTNLMRPYPGRTNANLPEIQRIFNYRLSRARRVIENTFGIMAARWKVLDSPLSCSIDKAENIVKAIVCLHNMLMDMNGKTGYCPPGFIDREQPNGLLHEGAWRQHVTDRYFYRLGVVGATRACQIVNGMRNHLAQYLTSPVGYQQAPWQYDRAFRGANINVP